MEQVISNKLFVIWDSLYSIYLLDNILKQNKNDQIISEFIIINILKCN